MKTLKIIAAGIAIALVPASAAFAQFDAASNGALETFSQADLEAALEANGATHEIEASNQSTNVTFSNGIKANAALMVCPEEGSNTNCLGTSLLATFTAPDGNDRAEVERAIAEYNFNENFGRAYIDPEGRISVRIYIIADGGITRENYRRQIELWSSSAAYFTKYLYGSQEKSVEV